MVHNICIVSRRSGRAGSRLLDGEIVELIRRGSVQSPGPGWLMSDDSSPEDCILIKTQDARWFGWMVVGRDIDIEIVADSADQPFD